MDLPAGVVCMEEGCTQPGAVLRPSTRDHILEDADGKQLTVLPAGTADEVVCTQHAGGEQP